MCNIDSGLSSIIWVGVVQGNLIGWTVSYFKVMVKDAIERYKTLTIPIAYQHAHNQLKI